MMYPRNADGVHYTVSHPIQQEAGRKPYRRISTSSLSSMRGSLQPSGFGTTIVMLTYCLQGFDRPGRSEHRLFAHPLGVLPAEQLQV